MSDQQPSEAPAPTVPQPEVSDSPSTRPDPAVPVGGTTAAAVHVLDDAAVKAAFANAMRACRDRSAELGRS